MTEKCNDNVAIPVLAAVCNIPPSFRSVDLRNYFSQIIEERAFTCFHYKHRPEVKKDRQDGVTKDSCVCVVSMFNNEAFDRLMDLYHNKNWISKSGEYLSTTCLILKLSSKLKNNATNMYYTKMDKKYRNRHSPVEEFTTSDLKTLSELNPPRKVMPNGNVGTPIPVFQKLIQNCELPSSIIGKLGLIFPGNASNRKYGNVPYLYESNDTSLSKISSVFQPKVATTGNGCVVDNHSTFNTSQSANEFHQMQNGEMNKCHVYESCAENNQGESDSCDDNDTCEEWERHEAFYNDVTSQERAKERLFEEEIELKWEKGGSGLVFYTDAQYWAEEGGDFDEQNTDHWDVDTREFYGEEGDRDAKDFVQMCKEKKNNAINPLKENKKMQRGKSRATVKAHHSYPAVGHFEAHTKGIGTKILKKFGWKENEALDASKTGGLTEPIVADGRTPNDNRGLGYHGEKIVNVSCMEMVGEVYVQKNLRPTSSFLDQPVTHKAVEPLASHSYLFPQFRSNLMSLSSNHKQLSKNARHKAVPGSDGVIITTKYDDPLEIDEDSGILRSQHPCALKHNTTNKALAADKSKLVESVPLKKLHYGNQSSVYYLTSTKIRPFTPRMQFVRPANRSEWSLNPQ